MNKGVRTPGLLILGLAALQATPAFAQTALEEIVVTANRREENLQQVPIAVSAITGSMAQQRGVVDLQSIATAVPGLTTGRTLTSNSPYIRGVGNPAPEPTNEPAVATYVDNVYMPTAMGSVFEFNNIERVEVLKGPQGTLFGRNATGGVIHVLTRDPTETPSIDANVGYARFNTWSGNFYGTTAIADGVAANLALHASDRSKSWGRNLNTGSPASIAQDFGSRAKLAFSPIDDTSVLLSASYNRSKGAGSLSRSPFGNAVVANPPGLPVGHIGRFGDVNLTVTPNATFNTLSFSGKLDHDFDAARLVSITAYVKAKGFYYFDLDISPANTQIVDTRQFNRMFSQELQLKAPVDSKVQWIVGGFYMHNTGGYDPQRVIVSGGALIQETNVSLATDSFSGFAQATAEVLPETHLTVGARYTRDKRSVDGTTAVNGTINPAVTVRGRSTSWKKATWRVALDHQFTDDLMAYASVNTGFKSGLYNPVSYTLAPANPETLTAYETGVKSQWFDNRLRLNASLFYYDYKNLQVTVIIVPAGGTAPSSLIQNAAKATVKGADIELTAAPVENLTITSGVSLLDAQYADYPNGNHFTPRGGATTAAQGACAVLPYPAGAPGGQVAVSGCDLSGNQLVQAPKATFNLSGYYKIPTSSGDVNLALSYYHTSKWYFEADNSVFNRPYELVNASVSWTSSDGGLGASLWGRNLTNTRYLLSGASSSATRYYAAAEPRTYGVTLTVHR